MLKRASVLVGVRKTGGGLPVLHAVGSGVEMMAKWANSQLCCGMQEVIVLSDANNEHGEAVDNGARQAVKAYEITEAITKLVEGGLQQLIVYFAGHGANVRYNELWLLSGAPQAASEAVNLKGSIEIAKQCGVAHIVIIADACRTAAATLQAQAVEGSLVFPSNPSARRPGKVDVFYAAVVGRPALELQEAAEAQRKFIAVYTKSLAEGLNGKAPLETAIDGDRQLQVVRSWPLQRYLERAVPNELERLNAPISLEQAPDAEIMSPPESWISQPNVDLLQVVAAASNSIGQVRRGGLRQLESGGNALPSKHEDRFSKQALHSSRSSDARRLPQSGSMPHVAKDQPTSLRNQAQSAITSALYSKSQRAIRGPTTGGYSYGSVDEYAARARQGLRTTDLPSCGFVTRGIEVAEVFTTSAAAEQLDRNQVHFPSLRGPAASVLIVLKNGYGTLLPVIQNYVATLNFDEGELAEVSYELISGFQFGEDVAHGLKALGPLRQTAAAASRLGVLSPNVEHRGNLTAIADRLSAVDWLDISLDIYFAYAFASQGQDGLIKAMQCALRSKLEVELFDIALLLRGPGRKRGSMKQNVFPPVPLLTRGWALLNALGVVLPPSLRDVAKHVTNSPWTLFDKGGVDKVRASIFNKEIF